MGGGSNLPDTTSNPNQNLECFLFYKQHCILRYEKYLNYKCNFKK